jgi:hypothetical protein
MTVAREALASSGIARFGAGETKLHHDHHLLRGRDLPIDKHRRDSLQNKQETTVVSRFCVVSIESGVAVATSS